MHQDHGRLLRRTSELALGFLDGLVARPVGRPVAPGALRAALGGPLPERGEAPLLTIERLARDADPGLVASAGPRFFGFVTGGAHPAALAADWLTTAWDQLAAFHVSSPAAAAVEEVAAAWLVELLGLGARAKEIGVGFTTGCTMANFTALAAAGTWTPTGYSARRRCMWWSAARRMCRSSPPCRCSASAATAWPGPRPTPRAGCAPRRCARCWPVAPARPSSAPRPAM